MDKQPMREFFEPESVAIIGASEDPKKIGNELLRNIIEAGYKGKIFPINPKASNILGIAAYSSVEKVPDPVELAIIVVPSTVVPTVLDECARKKVKAAIIISGGFREIGEQGKQLEMTLSEKARKAGIRIIGPNCQGVNDPHSGLRATFAGFARLQGPIGIISQSGTVSAALQCWADREGIGISKCVNLGNRIDVNEIELLQYLKNDSNTKAVALYLEGVADGRAFMSTLPDVTKKKPVVVLKGGRTKAGSKAMLSHTSSLAGKAEIFDAALKQTGCIGANRLEELYDIVKAFSFLPLPQGNGVLIIESSGGAGILAADMCERLGLKLPEPDEQAKSNLRKVLSPVCVYGNPFDLTTEALDSDRFRLVIEENMENSSFNAFLAIFGDPIPGAAEVIRNVSAKTRKPIVVAYLGGGEVEVNESAKMHSMGIPVFPSSERAVIALHALVEYSESLSKRTLT